MTIMEVIKKIFHAIYMFFVYIFRFFKGILNGLLIGIIVAGIVGLFLYAQFKPMYEEAAKEAYEKLVHLDASNFKMLGNTVVFDKDGNKIGEINSGSYKYVKISKISDYLQQGYIATEDKRFMEHAGIDLQSITRAAYSLFSNDGQIRQGGSTITQQVIKNNLLSQEQSFGRKLTEVLLAPELEKKFNKADIMEFYCNSNYYGNQCYGVENAARYYFGCHADEVSLAQAAMICGISNSPNNYNPIASMKLAKEKQRQVLDNMLAENYITEKQYQSALKEKIVVEGVGNKTSSENYMVSYAIDCATKQLMEDNGFEFKYIFNNSKEEKDYKTKYSNEYSKRAAEIRAGGYRIYTSFNQKLQRKLQNSVSKTLSIFTGKNKKTKKYNLQGAAMCIDNKTQYVVAAVGGRNKGDQFNRAFLAKRQPGSTIKPLLDYGPAVDNGVINGSSVFNDSKVYWDESNKKSYSPKNSGGGYRGHVAIREALARSINTIAFQVYKKTGSTLSLDYLNKMKFSSISYADMHAPAVSLGGFTYGISVNDMCRGYATLENDGKYSSRTCITKIDHEARGTIYSAPDKEDSETEVYSADTSFIMKDIMQGTFNEGYGTAHSAYNDGQIYAGKTGTTSSNRDAWFCGFSTYYTTSVWIGYDIPKEMAGMYGGTYPLKIWSSYMNSVHKNLKKENFEIPKTIELRRVYGGNYSKTEKEINYSDKKRYYSQRPSGYEYYPTQNTTRKTNWKTNYLLEASEKQAKAAVEAFEDYKIKTVKQAKNFEKEYDKVIGLIEKIPDEYKQSEYKERAAKKFSSLSEEAEKNWKEAIEEYEQDRLEKIQEQHKIDAENSKIAAKEHKKKSRINKVEWYITKLQNAKYYTKVTKGLIKKGDKALKRTKEYGIYQNLKARWDAQVKRVKKLPKAPTESKKNKSSQTEDDNGNNSNNPSNPTVPDVSPTAEPLPTLEP